MNFVVTYTLNFLCTLILQSLFWNSLTWEDEMCLSKMENTPIAVLECTIGNFSRTNTGNIIVGTEEKVELLGSLVFNIGYTKSDTAGYSIYLSCSPKNRMRSDLGCGAYDVEYSLHIMNADGQSSKSSFGKHRFFGEESTWVTESFNIDLETLSNPANKYVVNNQLKVAAKIYSIVRLPNRRNEELKFVSTPVTPPTVFETYLDAGIGADVLFVAKDNTKVKAHSGILIAASPVFKAMFATPMQEKNTRQVQLEDMTTAVSIQTFLKCVYTGSLSHLEGVDLKVLKEVINAAEKYELEALKHGAGNLLLDHICPRNAVHLLNFAKRYGLKEIEKSLREYGKANVEAVMDSTPDPDMEPEEIPDFDFLAIPLGTSSCVVVVLAGIYLAKKLFIG